MSKEISVQLMCIQMRSGVEIWVEKARVEKLQNILDGISGTKFITFDDQTINTADVVGIFQGKTMDEFTRRKNGQWKCHNGRWHDRGEKCSPGNCVTAEEEAYIKAKNEAMKNCKRNGVETAQCNGWVSTPSGMKLCDCIKKIKKPR